VQSPRMAADELQHLRMLAKTFPADLGLNSAPAAPAAAEPSQQHQASDGADCKMVNGQKFYNFDQLVQALVGSQADPVRVLAFTEEEKEEECEGENSSGDSTPQVAGCTHATLLLFLPLVPSPRPQPTSVPPDIRRLSSRRCSAWCR